MRFIAVLFVGLITSLAGCKTSTGASGVVKDDSSEPVSLDSTRPQDVVINALKAVWYVDPFFSCSAENMVGGEAAAAAAVENLDWLVKTAEKIVAVSNAPSQRRLRVTFGAESSMGITLNDRPPNNPIWLINISCVPGVETASTIWKKFELVRMFAMNSAGRPGGISVVASMPNTMDANFLAADFDFGQLVEPSVWQRISRTVNPNPRRSRSKFILSGTSTSHKVPADGGWIYTIDVRTIKDGSLGDLGTFLDSPTTFPPVQTGDASSNQ